MRGDGKVYVDEGETADDEESDKPEEKQEESIDGEECGPRHVLPDPGQPTEEQLEEHRRDHVPFRSWCPWCVMARAMGEQHRANKKERQVPVFSFDYLFLTKRRKVLTKAELLECKDDEAMVKVLAAYDTRSKAIFGHVVPVKGVGEDRYAVDRLTEDIRWLGYSKVSLRSDNEPAIVDLLTKTLIDMRVTANIEGKDAMDQIIEEHSSRYDSSSNGAIENADRKSVV